MIPFEKMKVAKYKSKGAIIAEQLLQKIQSGTYPSGSKLPAERIISEQMGVSRPSVREAISALHIIGIVESRPGDGNYVAELLDFGGLSYQLKNIFDKSDSPYEILQARRAFEAGAVSLAIEEARDQDIENIIRIWNQKRALGQSGDFISYTRMGNDLHYTIAQATRNRIVISVVERLLNITDQPLWPRMRQLYLEKHPEQMQRSVDVHERLVKAIQERKSYEAIKVIEEHFNLLIGQLYNANGME
ncbi:MAG: FCD domain-containing protein [Desulfofustis sp.]|jgi:GntR family transcriptional regulator, transcriptional repressor for pyruvate dehydrogenase complex